MNASRFDTFTRTLVGRHSRRATLSAAGAAIVAALSRRSGGYAQEPTPTPLPVCTDPSRPGVGCSCITGTQDPCGPGTLLCCATVPNAAPGAEGVCTPSSVGCNPTGRPTCTGRGCRCNAGTENPCSNNLVCCQDNPGLPGGPGRCAAASKCNQVGCTGEGCFCQSGTREGCDAGLVCCAHDSSIPGGPGRCEAEDICFGQQCQATTNPCPSRCEAGAYCRDCCSGHCGPDGHCGTPHCEGIGCPCRGGVDNDCSSGLVCCQSQMTAPNVPGGPGMCAAPDACGNGGGGTQPPQATPIA